ncbi:hypothetical protein KSP40_PGU014378 [Platanthera guangdongensis]|uniref:Histone H2B n=1 Tax=Platanthera guangdongensis TaxID=2320717 RepID=A0ABR2LU00_9ASPA
MNRDKCVLPSKAEKRPTGKKPRAEKGVPSWKDGEAACDKKKKKSKQNYGEYSSIMSFVINNITEKFADESYCVALNNKNLTIFNLEIQTAVISVLRGEFAKHVVKETTRTVAKFTSS